MKLKKLAAVVMPFAGTPADKIVSDLTLGWTTPNSLGSDMTLTVGSGS